ncbi:MAG: hypothetical protein AB4050_07070 [Synechococcus sp.]
MLMISISWITKVWSHRQHFLKKNGDSFDKPFQITPSFYVEQSNKALGHGSSPGFLKPLVKRSFLIDRGIRHQESIRVMYDFFFTLDILIAGARFHFLPDPHYFYLVRPGSLCRLNDDRQAERTRIFIEKLQQRLNDARVSADPELNAALLHKLGICQKRLAYQTIVAFVYRKHYWQAFTQTLKHPIAVVHFVEKSFQKFRRAFN